MTDTSLRVHVGLMKTGSTTLQEHVFTGLPGVEFLNGKDGDKNVKRAIAAIVKEDQFRFSTGRHEAATRAVAARTGREGKRIPLISSEALTIPVVDRTLKAERLKQVFGPARVLIVLRHPVTMLCSLYAEEAKNRGYRLRAIGDVNDWLDEKWSPVRATSVARNLEFTRLIGMYEDLFGKLNVTVLFFEDLSGDVRRFAQGLAEWLGVESVGEIERRLAAKANPRMGRKQLYAARLSRWQPALSAVRWVRGMLPRGLTGSLESWLSRPVSIRMSSDWTGRIVQFFERENRSIEPGRLERMCELGYFEGAAVPPSTHHRGTGWRRGARPGG
ncbi:MAG: hypothetical protein WB783_18585 [Arenicellales bacterium]